VLLTTEASLAALGAELAAAPPDLRRFRPNVHLRLDAGAWAELGWAGGRIRFAGGVELALLGPCERSAIAGLDPDTQVRLPALLRHLADAHGRSFGIGARVTVPGVVTAGEAVELTPPG
jgi:uncharacterized protein YcbX